MNVRSLSIALFILALTQLSACVGTQTFSNAARNGDTIVVAMGKTDGAAYIDVNDLSARVIDKNGTPHDVTLRTLARVYPDPTSGAVLNESAFFGVDVKYDGEWMAIIDLVTPGSGALPGIPGGPATLELLHPTQTFYSPALEILPGTGAPHPLSATTSFGVGLSQYLSPAPHIVVTTTGVPSAPVAGATFIVHYDPAAFPVDADSLLRVSKFSTDPNIQLLTGTKDLPGGMKELTVMVINPRGFDAATLADFTAAGKSRLRDLSFLMTWAAAGSASGFVPNVPADISLVDAQFVDVDGDPVGGVVAEFGGGYGYLGL